MSNIENDIRRTSLRIDEGLAAEVERLAEENERSFNNQLIILLRKGIKLVNAEEHLLDSSNPVSIIKSASDAKNPHNKGGGTSGGGTVTKGKCIILQFPMHR